MVKRLVAACKGQESPRQLVAVHLERAHGEVQSQHIIDVIVNVVVILQQVGDGSIQVAAALF